MNLWKDWSFSARTLYVGVATLAMLGSAQAQSAETENAPLLNGCSVYADRTADDADRILAWTYGVESDPERCIKVRVGQTVTFEGNLNSHPIDALGGDAPNPFAGALSTTANFTFERAGAFGFVCIFHDEMQGVVWVVE